MTLVAGVDSSTQSCKVVIRDAETGDLVRQGRAEHPDGTEIDPQHWWRALTEAVAAAGGLDDVAALAVGAQQHGMVVPRRRRSGGAAGPAVERHPVGAAGGPAHRAARGRGAGPTPIGVVPVASFTVTKLAGWPSTSRTPRRGSPRSACRTTG